MNIQGVCFNKGASNEILITTEKIFSLDHPIIYSTQEPSHDHIIHIREEDILPLQEKLANIYYPNTIKFIGITGTNGKTSTAFIGHLLIKCYYLGTLGFYHNGTLLETLSYTSPPYLLWRKLLTHKEGFCFVEVSSHALDQERFYNTPFEVGAWTNFSQDHLDYHLSMESYFQAKKKIFQHTKTVFLGDQTLKNLLPQGVFQGLANFIPEIYQGSFQEKNFSLALDIVHYLKISPDLSNIQHIPGRCEKLNIVYKEKNLCIYIDYAHTPDAMQVFLENISVDYVIFGCGGNRDTSKRPLMGTIARKYSKNVVFTEDNSRFESFENIFKDVQQNFFFIENRKQAIQYVLEKSEHNDTIAILGKGSETTIDRGDSFENHNDKEFLLEMITK